MVYAMFIGFLLFLYIQSTQCQTTTTVAPNYTYGCSFLADTYSTTAAVTNQFQFPNRTSILLTASYAFVSSSQTISTFDVGLIYPVSTTVSLVPFPVLLNCTSIVSSCQLITMAGSTVSSRDSEPIRVQFSSINYTSTSIQLNQMSLYLKQGQYQLSNCLFNDGRMTDPQTSFNIQIQYEKSVGTLCNPSTDICGSSSLTTCSSSTSTCTCLSSSTPALYSNAYYCADSFNASNCTIFPTRCITWCNSTVNNLCICPSDTLKIQRNSFYVCELPVNSLNCSIYDNIRRCPLGQNCTNGQCTDNVLITTVGTTVMTTSLIDLSDRPLRIALGVIAGLLGTSVLVLLGVFCWLRQKQKRRRTRAEKSHSPPSLSSSTSSLYIAPTQQGHISSTNAIYQLPIETNAYQTFSPIHRSESFRQAVLSNYPRTNQTTEHVSTKRNSFIGRTPYQSDDLGSPTYSTLEFTLPSPPIDHHNVYQVIHPPSSPNILTHIV